MDISELTGDTRVKRAVQQAAKALSSKPVSDITDADGHQYVDLVMEGGGVLGVALAGYCYVLEKAGIRFLGLGGTSAGSINALAIAALGAPHEAKAEAIADLVANVEMATFLDGDSDARDFTNALVGGAGSWKLAWAGAQVVDNFKQDLGLHPGHAFENWLRAVLDDHQVSTASALEAQMQTPPPGGWIVRPCPIRKAAGQDDSADITPRLAIIAADITTGAKVEFPKMASLYWDVPEDVHPAQYVRASMAVPALFHPVRIRDLPHGRSALSRWDKLAGLKLASVPHECLLVDGGIMSNFPIAVFHRQDRVPRAPTFGVKLGMPPSRPRRVDQLGAFIGGVFNAARGALDRDFLLDNPDYKHLIEWISIVDHTARPDADGELPDHNWLNFNLRKDAKIDLFRSGAVAAADFLKAFDWDAYKSIRKAKASLREGAGPARSLKRG